MIHPNFHELTNVLKLREKYTIKRKSLRRFRVILISDYRANNWLVTI